MLICDPDANLFEPTIVVFNRLMQIYTQKKDKFLLPNRKVKVSITSKIIAQARREKK